MIIACVCLVSLILGAFVIWIIIENQSVRKLEPTNLYFFNTVQDYPFDNQTYMKVWNSTKTLEEISEISKLGNYSVLITWNPYRVGALGYTEWFVVASTLQPDKNGFIHQISFRLNLLNFTLIASYEQTFSYNLTSVENGTKTIEDFISEVPPEQNIFHANYPFLIVIVPATDFGAMAILNLETGKIMIAATIVWNGAGGLLYPENIPNLGDLSPPSF